MTLSDKAKAAARKQLEFYFSDSNLPRDAFMLEKVEQSADGWVSLALLCTFARMRQHLELPTGVKPNTIDKGVVAEMAAALEHSSTLTVNEDKTAIKRSKPLDRSAISAEKIDARSVYAAPFPHDATLDAMIDIFDAVSPVAALRMRRHLQTKDFRGSVFVEFTSEEAAKTVLATRLVFAGAVLQLQPKAQYLTRKKDAAAAKAAAEKAQAAEDAAAVKSEEKAVDASAAEKAAESAAPVTSATEDTKDATAAPPSCNGESAAVKTEAGAVADGEPGQRNTPDNAATPATGNEGTDEKTYELAKGCCVSLKMEEPVAGVSYVAIKQALGGRDAGIRYIHFPPGEKEGFARFGTPEAASQALAKAPEGKLPVESASVQMLLLSGEEEAAILDKAVASMKAKDARDALHAGSRGRYGRGGARGSGGRGRDFGRGGRGGNKRKHDGANETNGGSKVQKTE